MNAKEWLKMREEEWNAKSLSGEDTAERRRFLRRYRIAELLQIAVDDDASLNEKQEYYVVRCVWDLDSEGTSDLRAVEILSLATYISSCRG